MGHSEHKLNNTNISKQTADCITKQPQQKLTKSERKNT